MHSRKVHTLHKHNKYKATCNFKPKLYGAQRNEYWKHSSANDQITKYEIYVINSKTKPTDFEN